MLQLYTDLRRYISARKAELEENTYGWYVKTFCEHAKNQRFVAELMDGLKEATVREYYNDDYYLFNNMLDDYHVNDALRTEEAIMLKLILSCFLDDFILEVDHMPIEYQYQNLTNVGRMITGNKPNVLSNYLEKEWTDLSHLEFNGDKLGYDEIVKGLSDGSISELFEDCEIVTATLVVDEHDSGLALVELLLDGFDFFEVEPGLYFFGIIYYPENPPEIGYLNGEDLNDIICDVLDEDKQRVLDDDLFYGLNEEIKNMKVSDLINKLQICTSSREVMF